MPTIIVLGAAGRIGDAAARAFLAHGWRVKGAARGEKIHTLADGVERVEVDATDPWELKAACTGCDVIFHGVSPLYTDWSTALPMARNVASAAEAVGATILLPGTVYNFGHDVREAMTEDQPEVASTEKGKIRIALEALLREPAETRGVQTLVLRAGDFFGGTKPGGWLDEFILAKLGRDGVQWGGLAELPHAFAYLPDLAEAFVRLAEKRDELPAFDRFHFTGHTLTGTGFHAAAEAAVGRRLKRTTISWPLMRLVGLANPMVRELAIMSYLWKRPHSLDGAKLVRLIGTVPHTPLVSALRQAIADLDLDPRQAATAARLVGSSPSQAGTAISPSR